MYLTKKFKPKKITRKYIIPNTKPTRKKYQITKL